MVFIPVLSPEHMQVMRYPKPSKDPAFPPTVRLEAPLGAHLQSTAERRMSDRRDSQLRRVIDRRASEQRRMSQQRAAERRASASRGAVMERLGQEQTLAREGSTSKVRVPGGRAIDQLPISGIVGDLWQQPTQEVCGRGQGRIRREGLRGGPRSG